MGLPHRKADIKEQCKQKVFHHAKNALHDISEDYSLTEEDKKILTKETKKQIDRLATLFN